MNTVCIVEYLNAKCYLLRFAKKNSLFRVKINSIPISNLSLKCVFTNKKNRLCTNLLKMIANRIFSVHGKERFSL